MSKCLAPTLGPGDIVVAHKVKGIRQAIEDKKAFQSENEVIKATIATVSAACGKRGVWVLDRGGDRAELFRGEEPFAFAGATTKPGHFCRCPGFVNEDKTFWIKPMLPCAPRYPGFGDVRPILFGCVRGFF